MERAPQQKGILVVLGQNWENYHHLVFRKKHGIEKGLSKYSIQTTIAADILLQSDMYHTIIFSTGHTNGTSHISEADAMANLLQKIDPRAHEKAQIFRETKSFDTPSNIHEVMDIITQQDMHGPIDVVAPHYHMPRVKTIAKGLNFPIEHALQTEKVLGIRRSITPVWEFVLRPLAHIDPEGKIPRLLWTGRRTR